MKSAALGGLLVLAAAMAAACAGARAGGPVAGAGLEHAYRSQDALARAVLAGLAARDTAALRALLVTRSEHRELLWPQLPEHSYMSFEEARALNERNTRKALRRALDRYGGRSFVLAGLTFTGEPERYEGFTIHRGARLEVRRPESGEVGVLPILNVVLEKGGYWKLMHYDE